MPDPDKFDLNHFYTKWEKYALQYLSPRTRIKTNFDLYKDPQLNQFIASSPIVTYIINHADSTYEFFSENCLRFFGYTSEEFMHGGVPFGMSLTDEAYTDHVANFLIPKVFEYTEKYSRLNVLDQIQFSYNYRVRRKDGSKFWNLQLMRVIETDENGHALLTLVHLTDISHIKKDHKVDFCVNRRDAKGIYETIYMESYPAENSNTESILSPREIEVLLLISKGESSKSIAGKLNISINTVHNHRKRMLEKTGCKNSSELINYGRCKGISMPTI